MPSRPRRSAGRERAFRPIPGRGSFRPVASGPSMASGGGPASMRRCRTSPSRQVLSAEATRLVRLYVEVLPEPEATGLLALMLLHDSRRAARTSPAGELVLLADQDRSLWNRQQIAEGSTLVQRALASRA